MYTQDDYLYGWLFYLLGVFIVMVCGWLLTRRWPILLRQLLRLWVGVVLVVPWYASAELDYFAPAWIIASFEGLFDGDGAFWRAGTPLLVALGSTTLVYGAVFGLLAWRTPEKPQQSPN